MPVRGSLAFRRGVMGLLSRQARGLLARQMFINEATAAAKPEDCLGAGTAEPIDYIFTAVITGMW